MADNKQTPPGGLNKFSRVEDRMQRSAAFKSLSASAIRVLLWALFENFESATKKGATGKPTFKLTNADALKDYGLHQQTFSRAKNELHEKGFLEWVTRGGLLGVNGVCSTFCLSNKWKDWKLPMKSSKRDMSEARAALEARKNAKRYGKTLKSVNSN